MINIAESITPAHSRVLSYNWRMARRAPDRRTRRVNLRITEQGEIAIKCEAGLEGLKFSEMCRVLMVEGLNTRLRSRGAQPLMGEWNGE